MENIKQCTVTLSSGLRVRKERQLGIRVGSMGFRIRLGSNLGFIKCVTLGEGLNLSVASVSSDDSED